MKKYVIDSEDDDGNDDDGDDDDGGDDDGGHQYEEMRWECREQVAVETRTQLACH